MRRVVRPLLLTPLLAILLFGCGGADEDQPTSGAASHEEQVAKPPKPPAGQAASQARTVEGEPAARPPQGGQERQEESDSQPVSAGAAPRPGAKAPAPGVPVQAGGDNSIQTFGVEGETDQRDQALETLKTYLDAALDERWTQACEQTSREFKDQLAQMASAMGREKLGPEDCPTALPRLIRYAPRAEMRAAAAIDELLSFRVEGGYAYAIFAGVDDKVSFIAMADDEGLWKVNTVAVAPFQQGS